jgi:hypothetical protein
VEKGLLENVIYIYEKKSAAKSTRMINRLWFLTFRIYMKRTLEVPEQIHHRSPTQQMMQWVTAEICDRIYEIEQAAQAFRSRSAASRSCP